MTNTSFNVLLAAGLFSISCGEKEDASIDTSSVDQSDTDSEEESTDTGEDATEDTDSEDTDSDDTDTAEDTDTDTTDTDTDSDTDTDTNDQLNELTVNGDFERGDISGWTDFSSANNGTFSAVSTTVNTGAWAGNIVANVSSNGPASFPVVKQANLGEGIVLPNSSITISFDLFGELTGEGHVVIAEFFSELSGGGTSKSEMLGGGPLFAVEPNDWTTSWTNYSFTTTTGPDVSGGVTFQIKADCGANPGCMIDLYIDNVSVSVE